MCRFSRLNQLANHESDLCTSKCSFNNLGLMVINIYIYQNPFNSWTVKWVCNYRDNVIFMVQLSNHFHILVPYMVYFHGIVIDILTYICIWCTVDWTLPYFSVMIDIVIDIISHYWLSIEHHCCSVSTASCCSLVWCKSNSLLVCILLMCRFTDGLNHKCFKLTWNISCDSAHCNLSRLTYFVTLFWQGVHPMFWRHKQQKKKKQQPPLPTSQSESRTQSRDKWPLCDWLMTSSDSSSHFWPEIDRNG